MRPVIDNKLASLYQQNTIGWLLNTNLQTKHNADEPFLLRYHKKISIVYYFKKFIWDGNFPQ